MEGRTYKYYHGEPQYPFGYGLSYTKFDYSDFEVQVEGDNVSVSLSVNNTGELDGDEVVQVYTRKIDSKFWRPIIQLVGFKRISIKKGEQKSIKIEVDKKQFEYWDTGRQKYMIESGEYEIQVGSSSDNIKMILKINL